MMSSFGVGRQAACRWEGVRTARCVSTLFRSGCESSFTLPSVCRPPILRPQTCQRPMQNATRKFVISATSATAWDNWATYMEARPPVKEKDPKELTFVREIGSAISESARGYLPHYMSQGSMDQSGSFRQVHVDRLSAVPVSADLHQKLEAIGLEHIKLALGLPEDAPLDAASTSFTTTDLNAGIACIGCTTQKEGKEDVVVAFVATETERQASWSRLEGLLLHWAVSPSAGGPWVKPEAGWSAIPSRVAETGGALQCEFEKHTLAGSQQQAYVLVMKLPMTGVLRSGGLQFVLKASLAQNTKWLRDAFTDRDFFVDLHNLPVCTSA